MNSSFKNHCLYWKCLGEKTHARACVELLIESLPGEALLSGLADGKQEECESHFKDEVCLKTFLYLAYAPNRIQLTGIIMTIKDILLGKVFYERWLLLFYCYMAFSKRSLPCV